MKKLSIINCKLRRGRSFAVSIVGAMALAGLCLVGCSDSPNTAGVLSETESGQTAALTVHVTGMDNANAKVALLKISGTRTTVIDSATTDSKNNATFNNVPAEKFNIVATANGNDNSTLAGITTGDSLENGTVDLPIATAASVKFLIPANMPFGDTVCISGTVSCGVYDETAKDSGYILIQGIPATTPDRAYASYSEIEIIGENEVTKDSVTWQVSAGDTITVTKNADIDYIRYATYTLPTITLADSSFSGTLDSLIVPFKNEPDELIYAFMGADWNMLPTSAFSKGDTTISWVTLPPMDSTLQIAAIWGIVNASTAPPATRIRAYWEDVEAGATLNYSLFADSSFALSFWFASDSATPLISAMEDSVGIEIRACDSDSSALCTKIYNGIDTVATDTVEYAKVKAFDGNLHHYSLAIHKKHLSIVVDGVALRDTDIKLSENFYNLEKISIKSKLESIMLFSFGDFIRKPEDTGWARLNAWLQAFYELQK